MEIDPFNAARETLLERPFIHTTTVNEKSRTVAVSTGKERICKVMNLQAVSVTSSILSFLLLFVVHH